MWRKPISVSCLPVVSLLLILIHSQFTTFKNEDSLLCHISRPLINSAPFWCYCGWLILRYTGVIPLQSGVILACSGIFRYHSSPFRFIPVSFRFVPLYSGTILVHSVSFRCHSALFRHIPVYSGIFRSVPFRSVPVFSNARVKHET